MVCERPKCYRTKSDKCMHPNSWILFLQKNGGKGLTRSELKTKYDAWKSTRFPSNSTASSRRDLLCDDIASSPHVNSKKIVSRKKTVSKKVVKRKRTTSPQSDEHMAELRRRIRRLVKEDVERRREENNTVAMASEDDRSHLDRETILRNKRIADDLLENIRITKAAAKLASNYAKVIRSLRKKSKQKKEALRLARKKTFNAERLHNLELDFTAAEQRVATLEMLGEKRKEIRRDQAKAAKRAKYNPFADSTGELKRKREDLAAKKRQRDRELGINNISEKTVIRECGLSNSDMDKVLKIYPGANKHRRGENSCVYIQRIFGMGDIVPTTLFSVRDRFIIFNGLTNDSSFVFIKVGLVSDTKTLKDFRYRTYIQQKVQKTLGSSVTLPKFKYSSVIGVSRGKSAGIEATEGVSGNTTLLKYMGENRLLWPTVMKRLGETLRKMHNRQITHGDAHLENFMYDSNGRGSVIPIDLERSIVFSAGGYIRSKKTTDEALMYDVKEAFMSIRSFVGNLYESSSASHYVPYLEKFTQGYIGKEDLQPREKLWMDPGVNPEKLDFKWLNYLWSKKYSPILNDSTEFYWNTIKDKPENNFNF